MCLWIQKTPFNLPKLIRLHLRIVEVVKVFNSVFSQWMMLFIGSLFVWNCFGAFAFAVMRKSASEKSISAYVLVFNLGFSTTLLVFIVRTCEGISESKERMIELLYILRSRMCRNRWEYEEEISRFVEQMLHTNVKISCIFFDFNWKFLFQVRIFLYLLRLKILLNLLFL